MEEEEEEEEGMRRNLPRRRPRSCSFLQVKRKGESVRASASLIIVMVSVYTYFNKCHGYNFSSATKSTVSM